MAAVALRRVVDCRCVEGATAPVTLSNNCSADRDVSGCLMIEGRLIVNDDRGLGLLQSNEMAGHRGDCSGHVVCSAHHRRIGGELQRRCIERAAAPVTDSNDLPSDRDGPGRLVIERGLVVNDDRTCSLLQRNEMAAHIGDRTVDVRSLVRRLHLLRRCRKCKCRQPELRSAQHRGREK